MQAHKLRPLLLATAFLSPILACAPVPPMIPTSAPTSAETTASYEALRALPTPTHPVPVAVYSYPDLTGQLKASETISSNSRAVTQGAVWMLVKSLKDAGGGGWFKVIQRANLENLLKERQIIRETRGRIEQQTGQAQPLLPSLLFAGIILEGGIVGYDSNTVTGGIGARYLGIGGDAQYRQDTVTVHLNAISSQSGEILKSVMARKTVASYGVRGSVFKFVAFQKLLEGETGYTVNEPGQIAVAQAIEHAVRALIIEGALEGLWQFEDEIAGRDETQLYLADKGDDLLLGDAGTAVAQALLTEGQLKTLAVARDARRERLKAQAERRQQRQLASLAEPARRRPITAQPLMSSAVSPSPASNAKTAEELLDILKRRERVSLQGMVNTVTRRAVSKPASNGILPTKDGPLAPAKAKPINLSALYEVLAKFKAETSLVYRPDDVRFNAEDKKPRLAKPQTLDDQVLDAASTKPPDVNQGKFDRSDGQNL